MKRSEVLEALFQVARLSATRENHDGAFYGTLSLSVLTDILFGMGSPESLLIESYLAFPPSFVGPLPLAVQS